MVHWMMAKGYQGHKYVVKNIFSTILCCIKLSNSAVNTKFVEGLAFNQINAQKCQSSSSLPKIRIWNRLISIHKTSCVMMTGCCSNGLH